MTDTRTAAGPDGTGGDVPDGPQPLGGPVVIAISLDLLGQIRAIRWWTEEAQRATEAFLFDRADAIRLELVKPSGLLYTCEANVERLVALVTGVSMKTNDAVDSDGA